ncbi:hypothetical protein AAFF_G00415420 [Aldrovandia affinis]|uniref:Uncharacterized protein n=1 Tax=Aldrovandia affinis TaxID=143900 RepID=A0AAD7WJJ5_9TELE|nr:hypothetical protein AAFF_G00415420 [Aldrovandia affinis]
MLLHHGRFPCRVGRRRTDTASTRIGAAGVQSSAERDRTTQSAGSLSVQSSSVSSFTTPSFHIAVLPAPRKTAHGFRRAFAYVREARETFAQQSSCTSAHRCGRRISSD